MLGVFQTRRKLKPPKQFESAQSKIDSTHQYSFLLTFLFNLVSDKLANTVPGFHNAAVNEER
jgi:hypothetical protein